MRLFRPFSVITSIYPEAVFRLNTHEKHVSLTFDDGPDPSSTPVILDVLNRCEINAIFFCSGFKAEKYPELIERIKTSGHTIGNHGYSHLNGWKTSLKSYIEDTRKADEPTSSEIFRPPYGGLTPRQYSILNKKYRIFFWDLMPYDFDRAFGAANTLRTLKLKTRPGSVIVLHDNPLSCAGEILEDYIDFIQTEGYKVVIP